MGKLWGRHGNPKIRKYRHLLGTMPDKEFAKLVDCTPHNVYLLRRKAGMLCEHPGQLTGTPWTDWSLYEYRLGQDPDEVLAKELGISEITVRNRRARLHIPVCKRSPLRTCPCGNTFMYRWVTKRFCSNHCCTRYNQFLKENGYTSEEAEKALFLYGERKRALLV